MTRTPISTLAAALLSAAALSVPAQTVRAGQEIDATQTRDIGFTLRGIVASIDQSRDTIIIRLSSGRTEQFKVQDGLIFNAVRYGDQVEVSVQTIAGTKTIISLH